MTVKSLRNIGGGMGLRRRGAVGGVQTVMTAGAGFGTNEAGISFYYDRLMQVAIRNTFYNTDGGQCPDFTIAQSRHTQKLCKSLGLVVRNEGAGFSVLYDTLRAEALERYLRKHSPRPAQVADDGAGTRLSFALTLNNPDFCYFTDIPFDLDPNSACYYLSNRMAHKEGGRVVLNEGSFVPQSAPLPAVGGQCDVPFPDGVTEIEVADVLGNVLQCYPREVPIDLVDKDLAANQQVSYLLQRIEDYAGIAILASNLHSLMDAAFTRRFQSMIHFALPDAEQRYALWTDNFRDKPYALAADVDLASLAERFEIAGGNIVNVLRYACLKAVSRTPQEVRMDDILRGIQRERHKDGKFTKPD